MGTQSALVPDRDVGKLGLLQADHGEVQAWPGIPLMACIAHWLCCHFSILILLFLPGSPARWEQDSPSCQGGMSPATWDSGLPKVSSVGLGAMLTAWAHTRPSLCMGRWQ